MLNRTASLLFTLLFALFGALSFAPSGSEAATVFVDRALQQQLAAATGTTEIEAVVNYNRALTTAGTLAAAIQNLGIGTLTFKHLDSIAVIGTAIQINAITALPGVTGLYANRQLQYYLDDSVRYIGANRVWDDLSVTGRGIGIAVLDTGIDGNNPNTLYPSKTMQNVKVGPYSKDVFTYKGKAPDRPLYLENQRNTDTTTGHGTHVAGTAAGKSVLQDGAYTGVAPGAHLIGLGAGDGLWVFWVLAGFDYILEKRLHYNIKVVNNSWGTTAKAQDYDPNDPINQASKKAHDRGITVVFAAGNSGPDPDTMNHYAMPPWVIGVAAGCKPSDTVHCPDGLLTDFSSRGVPGSNQFHPTLTAPGAHIVAPRATTGTVMNILDGPHDATICDINAEHVAFYTCASGTSMASPHVAGTVALMQEAARGRLSPDQIKSILVQTATPMRKTNRTAYAVWEVGAGYLDAYRAVRVARR